MKNIKIKLKILKIIKIFTDGVPILFIFENNLNILIDNYKQGSNLIYPTEKCLSIFINKFCSIIYLTHLINDNNIIYSFNFSTLFFFFLSYYARNEYIELFKKLIINNKYIIDFDFTKMFDVNFLSNLINN